MKKTTYIIIAAVAALFIFGLAFTAYVAATAKPFPKSAICGETLETTVSAGDSIAADSVCR